MNNNDQEHSTCLYSWLLAQLNDSPGFDAKSVVYSYSQVNRDLDCLCIAADGGGIGPPLEARFEGSPVDRRARVDGEFDDVKTNTGHREVPFDERGVLLRTLERCRKEAKFGKPDDLVFANRAGNPIDRHNLLNRQIKPTMLDFGLPPNAARAAMPSTLMFGMSQAIR
jgi:hypothetical protein